MDHQDKNKTEQGKENQISQVVEDYETPTVVPLGALNTLIKGMSGVRADNFPQSGNFA